MKILVLGNAIVDVILNIKHLPQTGDDIYCEKQAVNIGGCAYNVATILPADVPTYCYNFYSIFF